MFLAGLSVGLFVLALVSGMLGLGVAFAAVPFLGLFLPDLVHQVQPLTLLLNGITALFATFGFARSSHVRWKDAILLATVTTIMAPCGALLAEVVPQFYIWIVYFAAVLFLAIRMLMPDTRSTVQDEDSGSGNLKGALLLAIPISVLAGLLGIGPGFLLMPTLMLLKFPPKKAAGITALAVTPPSFSAFLPHMATATINLHMAVALLIAGAIGAFLGARITSLYVPGKRLKQLFGVLIVITTAYKLYTMIA
ncbi:MAG: sulfite exporter TauE/SafE family protein [Terracidiphilus sp.]